MRKLKCREIKYVVKNLLKREVWPLSQLLAKCHMIVYTLIASELSF